MKKATRRTPARHISVFLREVPLTKESQTPVDAIEVAA
jgi:hypothetical protein